MTISVTEILKASTVLLGLDLLKTQEQQSKFRTSVEGELSSMVAGDSRQHTISKDRIVLQSFPDRSAIQIEYPSSEDDLGKLAEVADQAIAHTDTGAQSLQAVGYNLELVFAQDSEASAARYLAKRIFQDRGLFRNWELLGSGCKMHCSDGDKQWNIVMEPRLHDLGTPKTFMSVNLHFNTHNVPKGAEIASRLQETWTTAHEFIEWFDQWK